MPRNLDNSPAKARTLGALSGTRTLTDFVGKKDKKDYFLFNLAGSSKVTFNVGGIKRGATAKVNLLNAQGQVVAAANATSKQPASLNSTLAAGTYYGYVGSGKGDTRYSAQLTATAYPAPASGNSVLTSTPSASTPVANSDSLAPAVDPGGSIATALDIRALMNTSKVITGSLGGYTDPQQTSLDASDVYQFNLPQPTRLNAILNGLSGITSGLYLYDDYGALVASNDSASGPTLSSDLNTGTYYIRATGLSSAKRNYSLTLSPTPFQTTTMGDPGDIASTSYGLGSLSGTKTYKDFVSSFDQTDIYRFSVPQAKNVTVSMDGLGGLINFSLEADTNNDGIIDAGLGSRNTITQSSLTASLSSGITYYVRVTRSTAAPIATSYNINFAA